MSRYVFACSLLVVASCGGGQVDSTESPPAVVEPSGRAELELEPESEPEPEPESESEPEPEPEPETTDRASACPPEADWPEGMACVPGGAFPIGSADGEGDEQPPGEAYVDTFFLDVYEVTNARYRVCVAARACRPPAPYRRFRRSAQPVVAVRWHDAVAFCAALARRLPTDAEFERAAGGEDNTTYPWGNETDDACSHAVIRSREGEGCGTEITADVGSRPAGHFGVHDLAGNVHEWVADHFAPCLRGCRRECGDACFGDNPRGPCDGAEPCPRFALRSIRGGSWYWPLEHARASARRGAHPDNEAGHRFGFRCARDLVVGD